ncbi:hypothetical protein CEUSTIGMA_g12473.t1 [Chlamydomonas eustigma]|uniref:C3H1-type domain-containing protein n=1 Tax=Chlamydomonas eustigma TaxID=1157962 RepID=A0A250XPX0_9CHLO|nr:hypothetical protein CEUSTIGMA_g12473.t1 [Chlamydomonas eustigma]|eukprot:GAX85053.1 hypothetical protein CEUSTIGMA_g12473.t1 [Chlamydomonas eustigma]
MQPTFQSYGHTVHGANEDLYANDIARHLSIKGATSSEDVIYQLRGMNLGDDFWMYSFKVAPCAKSFSHKWTLCPCAHAGETARRRDPRLHPYRAVLCPLVKAKKVCPLGDNCLWSHNVFEHWLHPSRYKTRLCSFGRACNRPICFFAHSADELRAQHDEAGKEADDREYVMQLMMAQESGLIPPGSFPQLHHQMALPSLDNMLYSMNNTVPFPSALGRRSLPVAHSYSVPVNHPAVQQQHRLQLQQQQQHRQLIANQRHSVPQQQGPSLMVNLQESFNNSSAPLSAANVNGEGWTSSSHGVRISDPGMDNTTGLPTQQQQLTNSSQGTVQPTGNGSVLNGRTRMSDSGQVLTGRLTQQDVVELIPRVNKALPVVGTPSGVSGGLQLEQAVQQAVLSSSTLPPISNSSSSPQSSTSPPLMAPSSCESSAEAVRYISRTSSTGDRTSAGTMSFHHREPQGAPFTTYDINNTDPSITYLSRNSSDTRNSAGSRTSSQSQMYSSASPHGLQLQPSNSFTAEEAFGVQNAVMIDGGHTLPDYSHQGKVLTRGASGPLMSFMHPPHLLNSSSGRFSDQACGMLPGSSSSTNNAGGNPADAYVNQLVAQLQEQGVVQSKEQLVQSLSQLLAQLLVNN